MRALLAGDASVAMRAGDAIPDAGDADGPGMRTVREDCESAFRLATAAISGDFFKYLNNIAADRR